MRNLFTKRLLISTAAATMLFGSAITANAAQEDLFDAEYYAETYPDIAAVVGNDEEALLQHYLAYGITEGRNANAYFNTLAYRNAYADLDAAFGDDWDAYADHYVAYGISEGRSAVGDVVVPTQDVTSAEETTAEQTEATEESTATESYANAVLGDDVHFYVNGVKITLDETENVIDVIESATGKNVEDLMEPATGYDWTLVSADEDHGYNLVGFYNGYAGWTTTDSMGYLAIETDIAEGEWEFLDSSHYGKAHELVMGMIDLWWYDEMGLSFDFAFPITETEILNTLGTPDVTSDKGTWEVEGLVRTTNYFCYYVGGSNYYKDGSYSFWTDIETGELLGIRLADY